MFQTLLLSTALLCIAPAASDLAQVLSSGDVVSHALVEDEEAKEGTQAETKIYTEENEAWFAELIALNPKAAIISPVGDGGIRVRNPDGENLVLPETPKPKDVTLSTPK